MTTARPMPDPLRAIHSIQTANERPVTMPKTAHTAAPSTAIRRAGQTVGVVRERDLEEETAEQRERDEGEDPLVAQVERIADVGDEDAERGPVELVDRVEAEQDDDRVERGTAAQLVEVLAGRARLVDRDLAEVDTEELHGAGSAIAGSGVATGVGVGLPRSSSGTRVSASRLGTLMPRRRANHRSALSRASPIAPPRPPGRTMSTSSMPAPVARNDHSGGRNQSIPDT